MCSCGHFKKLNKTSLDTTATVERGVFIFMKFKKEIRTKVLFYFENLKDK